MLEIEIYEIKPEIFKTNVEVSACYLEINNEILLLQLSSEKDQAGKWGLPAGKLEDGESAIQAAKRELYEETGISFDLSHFHSLGAVYIRRPEIAFVCHAFQVAFVERPNITLSKEHISYKWISFEETKKLDLMLGAHQLLELYRKRILFDN